MECAREILKLSTIPHMSFEEKSAEVRKLLDEAINLLTVKLDFLESAVKEVIEKWV